MNVLSLFDGMSCGQIALERCNIKINNYFASEIDKYAIQVTQANYPNTIQLGDVTKVFSRDLPQIDLLIGGSPCQGFSFAGKGLNFDDPRSKLFFEFVRLKNELNPKYWLLENVKMQKVHEQVINKYLGVRPLRFNSKWVSAQSRERLFWTNMPVNSIPENKRLTIQDILEDTQRVETFMKYETLRDTGNYYQFDNSGKGYNSQHSRAIKLQGLAGTLGKSNSTYPKVMIDGKVYPLTIKEVCRLQTVPENYFDGILSNRRAFECLGNGWTIDIICHILDFIK